MRTAINPTRTEDYPRWYQEVITEADLAQVSSVRGCMIIMPWGYALWEMIQKKLDYDIKSLDHENIYCPLFIPLSHIKKEADHIEGFAKECAVVTHSKLKKDSNGNLSPASPLEEPLIIRPTSEMVIGELFAKKIQSYRDLPVLVNQWANIVRWEMRTRMFLRTSEFLWQEGHTAHQSEEEAHQHAITMLNCYQRLCQEYLAIPVVTGRKSINEKFPGAEETYTIEGIMQDGKALQMGTSHYLGQTFSKSCDIQYQDANKTLQYVHTTSWGVTTRLIGGLIMTHADDNGLICPPAVAPYQVVIIPFDKNDKDREHILSYCQRIKEKIEKLTFINQKIRVHIDKKNKKASEKKWSWVKKGVPIRLEIGKREQNNQTVSYSLRQEPPNVKHMDTTEGFYGIIENHLMHAQEALYEKAKSRLSDKQCPLLTSVQDFNTHFKQKSPSPALIYWKDNDEVENQLQKEFKASIRCYPDPKVFTHPQTGKCLFNPEVNGHLVLIAKAY